MIFSKKSGFTLIPVGPLGARAAMTVYMEMTGLDRTTKTGFGLLQYGGNGLC